MQWQHGSFTKEANGSLVMAPIAVDGRQLYSDPCAYKSAIYTRYNASEMFQVRKLCSTAPPLVGTSHRTKHLHYPTALRSPHRRLPPDHAPKPLQIRRLAPHPPLPRNVPAPNAAHNHAQPSHDLDARRRESDIQSTTLGTAAQPQRL